MVYSIEELKEMVNLYLNKQVKKKDLKLKSYDLKVFDKIVELKKLQRKKVINRKIARELFNEFMSGIDLKLNKLDYLRDVIDLYNNFNTLVVKSNKPTGEINSKIVGSKDSRIKVVA